MFHAGLLLAAPVIALGEWLELHDDLGLKQDLQTLTMVGMHAVLSSAYYISFCPAQGLPTDSGIHGCLKLP